MANRHLSRSLAMQSLFEWDFHDDNHPDITEVLERDAEEFAPGLDEIMFAKKLAEGVVARLAKLDSIIEKAAPDWPIDQIAAVDRNVLRLGLFELLFGDKNEVPARVAINEAIELAKTFGGENSGRFVNGVLGAVYKEMGEPGKHDVPAKKRRFKDVAYEDMAIDKLGGAVVYVRKATGVELAFVHDIFGYWTLSKGRMTPEEEVEAGTKRKVKEELSLDINLEEVIGTNEYIASDPERGKIRKQVTYFLAQAANPDDIKIPADKPGLTDAKWFPLQAVPDLKMYDDVVPLVTKAIKILLAGNK